MGTRSFFTHEKFEKNLRGTWLEHVQTLEEEEEREREGNHPGKCKTSTARVTFQNQTGFGECAVHISGLFLHMCDI